MRRIFNIYKLGITALLWVAACSTVAAMPTPAKWVSLPQPDGSTIMARHLGDEFYSYWEDEEHRVLTQEADGTWVVATTDDGSDSLSPTPQQVQQRRLASPMRRGIKPVRRLGNTINLAPRGLVILVQFSDVKFKRNNQRAHFNALFNSDNYTSVGATGSVKKYFSDQSNGQYVPVFDVVGPYTLDKGYAHYGSNDYQRNDKYMSDFVIEAVDSAAVVGNVDFSLYDNDNDGEVDFIYFLYAGTNEAEGTDANTIWPKNWSLTGALLYGTTHEEYEVDWWADDVPLPTYNGKKINNFACSSEINSYDKRTGIGTICHEFSHVLGLPDYYDTDYGTNNQQGLTPGAWSLMDHGSYNNEGRTPPNYSVYDKYFMGWLTPQVLNSSNFVQLTTAYNSCYQLNSTGQRAAARATTQQYYLENRQQTGWDTYLPGHGMIVWSVRYNETSWTNNDLNNTANTPRYTIIPADDKTSGIGADTDPFPGTAVVTEWLPYTTYPLTNISEVSADKSIRFSFMGAAVPTDLENIETTEKAATKLLRNGQVVIVRDGREYNILGL